MKNAMNFRPVGLMLLFCLIPLWAFAQSVMVKGVVKDTSGEAIIGASVLEKGTTNGTITAHHSCGRYRNQSPPLLPKLWNLPSM